MDASEKVFAIVWDRLLLHHTQLHEPLRKPPDRTDRIQGKYYWYKYQVEREARAWTCEFRVSDVFVGSAQHVLTDWTMSLLNTQLYTYIYTSFAD